MSLARVLLPFAACVATLVASCAERDGRLAAVRSAFEEGRYDVALGLLAELRPSGDRPSPPSLVHDLALCALLAGDLGACESAADELARVPDPSLAARGEFLLGNVAFARALGLADLARQPEAEPFALQGARVQARRAREAWRRAAMSRLDWPEARRNVERAARLERELERLAEEARGDEPPPEPQPEPEEPEGEPLEEPAEEPPTPDVLPALDEAELAGLLELLARKEREKLELRAARHAERNLDLERDW